MSNFKKLFTETLSPFVGKNITRKEANDLYIHILKHAKNIDGITKISVDGNEKIHYFFNNHIGSTHASPNGIFQTHSNDFSRDGHGDTIILRGVAATKILKIGDKIKTPRYKNTVTILNLGDEDHGFNQEVTFKIYNGATIKSRKYSLLNLAQ